MKSPRAGWTPFFVLAIPLIGFVGFWHLTHETIQVGPYATIAAQTSQSQAKAPAPVSGASCALGVRPDPRCSPGSVQSTDLAAICQPGWASAHRYVPWAEWDQVFAEYGVTTHTSATYEVDHLIPLELGGSNDISNLFAESAAGPYGYHQKDETENAAHDAVCSGAVTLAYAQQQMAADWTILYRQLLGG